MARRKAAVLRALSDSHLRAIGRVAAQWSALELTLLYTLGQVARIDFNTIAVLAGAQNAEAWCSMMIKITGDTKQPGPGATATELDSILTRIRELGAKRNEVVHTSWHPRAVIGQGLLSSHFVDGPRPKAGEKATGSGVKKRGKSTIVPVSYTSREMLAIASQIAALERDVFRWSLALQKKNLADAYKRASAVNVITEAIAAAQPKQGWLAGGLLSLAR